MKYFVLGLLIYFLVRFFRNLYAFSKHNAKQNKKSDEPEIILTKKEKPKFVPSDAETISYQEIKDDE